MPEIGFLQNCEDFSDLAIYEVLHDVIFIRRECMQPCIAARTKTKPIYSRAITSASFVPR
jgi:hypothetical protein